MRLPRSPAWRKAQSGPRNEVGRRTFGPRSNVRGDEEPAVETPAGQQEPGGVEAVTEVTPAKGGDAAFAGEFGLVSVQIHPVDALQFQHDMFFLELGEAAG